MLDVESSWFWFPIIVPELGKHMSHFTFHERVFLGWCCRPLDLVPAVLNGCVFQTDYDLLDGLSFYLHLIHVFTGAD